jgi:NTP pyrophosphatase (non-canonical NTP hydrolase)
MTSAPGNAYNPDMPILPSAPRVHDLQKYVAELELERGFAHQDALQKCLLLGEEVGELFKAVRKATRMGVDPTAVVGPVADELADVLIYICCIANRFGIDLEQAFRDKEARNEGRTWQE